MATTPLSPSLPLPVSGGLATPRVSSPGAGPLVLGIDPGGKGAIAAMSLSGDPLGIWDWPGSAAELWELVAGESLLKPRLVAMEAQHGFFMSRGSSENGGRSATINFNLGCNYGIWQGVAAVLGWPMILVSTAAWRKEVLDSTVPASKPQKSDIIAFTRRRWPTAEIAGPRGGAKDGRAEALCLAEYARQRARGGRS